MKVDINKIDGYADMTPEEKLSALEAYEFEAPGSGEIERLKAALSKSNSGKRRMEKEIQFKTVRRGGQSRQGIGGTEAMEKELTSLRKEKSHRDLQSRFIWNWATMRKQRRKMPSSAFRRFLEGVFNQKKFIEAQKRRPRQARLTKQPGFPAGTR